MTRDEAKLYVNLVEDSKNNLIGHRAIDFFNLVKAYADDKPIKYRGEIDWGVFAFDSDIESYSVIKPIRKITVELTDEQIKQVETQLGIKIQ